MSSGKQLKMENIKKVFPGVIALDDVSIDLKRGEVLALVGENGAGKSTLIKILAGVYDADEGKIEINDKVIQIKGTKSALDLGIITIYQETSLVPDLSVAKNIFLGKEQSRFLKINWKKITKDTKEILENLSIDLSPDSIVKDLTPAQHQLVEIAKAFSQSSKIIIMDEPTASISDEEKNHLFSLIKRVIKIGTSVIYISHRLKEIFEIADRVVVLRDGKHVFDSIVKETNEKELVGYMLGKRVDDIFGSEYYESGEKISLSVRNLSRRGVFSDISFDLKEGEILGFSGLVGAGRSEIMRCIFGLDNFDEGKMIIGGKEVLSKKHSPEEAIKMGVAFVSEDRREESIIQDFSVKENLSLLVLDEIKGILNVINNRVERKYAEDIVKQFNIKTPSVENIVRFLSGGNQQKVAVSKILATKPKVLILDEPTKGIDVGAKKEIHSLIKEIAKEGVSVLLISSELPEILGMCHRVIVIRQGKIQAKFTKSEMNEDKILNAAFGIYKSRAINNE